MLTTEETDWIAVHMSDDLAGLWMKHRGDARAAHLIMQIECRRKAASKLRHTLGCKAFEFPGALSQEQSSSDRLAEWHASLVGVGETCVDLTAGLGIDVFHIAARAYAVTAVEINPETAVVLADNASVLGMDNVSVVCGDCRDMLRTIVGADCIFIDPARRGEGGKRVYGLQDCSPDVTRMLPDLMSRCRKLIVKMSPMLDIADTVRKLSPYICRIVALGDRRECKELVAICVNRPVPSAEVRIEAVTLAPAGQVYALDFTKDMEVSSPAAYSEPQAGKFLIDPYPSVMKAAPWHSVSALYGLGAIADNTHLYVGDEPAVSLGESYHIASVIPYSSGEIKRFSRHTPAAGVAVRNFPLRAEDLRKKLKIRDAESPRVYGVTDRDRRPLLLLCDRPGQSNH